MSHQEIDTATKLREGDSAVLAPCTITFSELSTCAGAPHAALGFDGARSPVSEGLPQEAPHMVVGRHRLVFGFLCDFQLCVCQSICVQSLSNDFVL